MCGLQSIIIIISFFQLVLTHSPKFDHESLSTPLVKPHSSISQTALTECHLQIECTAPQQQLPSRQNGSERSSTMRKIRIPVRAARGPQGPRGLRGPAGPRGPPGFNPEINDDVVANERIKRRAAGQRMPIFRPPEHRSIVWHLEEQKDYEDIHTLELRVGPYGFSDRLVSLEDFAGACSIEMARPNSSGALYCLSLESMLPELVSTSVGIVIDWDSIEGTTADEIWNAFQHSLADETIFRPAYAAYSASFPSVAAFSAERYLMKWFADFYVQLNQQDERVVTRPTVMKEVVNHLQSHQPRIAFFTGLLQNIEEMPPGQRVIMSNVVTNVGKAYDHQKGQFCAPVDGAYSFVVAISAQGRKQAAVRLMHNENHIFDVWSDSTPWSTATNQAILLMKKSDCVWLQLRESAFYLHGYMYSTFAGHFLFEYPDDQN
ncbi:hypothetical protein Aperf_G00000128143 [Anoplocephala perfoliata]